MQLVILIYHISGASAFIPVYMHVRVWWQLIFFRQDMSHFSFFWLKGDFGLLQSVSGGWTGHTSSTTLCLSLPSGLPSIYATMAMWPQILQIKANGNVFWHVATFYLNCWGCFFLFAFFAYSQEFFESVFSVWLFQSFLSYKEASMSGCDTRGMVFAFVYLVLQKCQILSEGKGEPLFSNRISNCLLFISVVSYITYSIWASR
ncbi:hypothetical protein NFI96_014048 [Prochilodus magdalenae]|nr:hypothetical protein NFI96_014048 [Prochilodus magdalenae]